MYLPSGLLSTKSTRVRTAPNPFDKLIFNCVANSIGLYDCVPTITCFVSSRGLALEI